MVLQSCPMPPPSGSKRFVNWHPGFASRAIECLRYTNKKLNVKKALRQTCSAKWLSWNKLHSNHRRGTQRQCWLGARRLGRSHPEIDRLRHGASIKDTSIMVNVFSAQTHGPRPKVKPASFDDSAADWIRNGLRFLWSPCRPESVSGPPSV